jgi:hypothetical protein
MFREPGHRQDAAKAISVREAAKLNIASTTNRR